MNLFGMKSGGMKRNPLAALMQPNLAEMLQPEGGPDEMPPSQPPASGYTPPQLMNPYTPGANLPSPQDPRLAQQAPKQVPLVGASNKPYELNAGDLLYLNPMAAVPKALWDISGPHPDFDERKRDINKTLGYFNIAPIFKDNLPPEGVYGPTAEQMGADPNSPAWRGSKPTATPQPSVESSSMDSLMNGEKNLDTAMGGGLFGSAIAATQDLLKKHAQTAQTLEGAKAALKHEFQDTPELDQIIAATQNELAQTKANRKQPGIGEFLTMALLNLSGMNPRQSADMVLGLSNQEGKENRLEDRLAQLEGGRATAKMHGRQEFRANEKQEKYQALQNMFRQQEIGRKQGNEDREFGFKNQKLGVDKLMQELGQIRQQMQFETSPEVRKKMQADIDRLDPYGNLQKKLQGQQTPIKDDRQSRMFGDMLGGGGFA